VVGILLLPPGGIPSRVQKVGETTDEDIEGRVRAISSMHRRRNRNRHHRHHRHHHIIVRDMGAALMRLREAVRNATGLKKKRARRHHLEVAERMDPNLFIGDLEVKSITGIVRDTPSHPILQGIQDQEVVASVIHHMTILWNTIGVIRNTPLEGLPMMNE
jgi:hypothetical protein